MIITSPNKFTPAPWINVLANPNFGSIITESGQMYTWIDNAHEFRLTPWNNDPVTDLKGEAFYLRDEESGRSRDIHCMENIDPAGTARRAHVCRSKSRVGSGDHVESASIFR